VVIEDVCDLQLGKMLSPAAKRNARPRPYLRNANVLWNRIDVGDLAEMDFSEDEELKFGLRAGDVLVCEGGEAGRAAVWRNEVPGCLYQKALIRLRPRRQQIDTEFLVFRLWLGSILEEFSGSHARTTITHLPVVRLAKLGMLLPPVGEQRTIAKMLNDEMAAVERARAAAEAQFAAAELLRDRRLRDLFEGPIGRGWPRRRLEEISEIVGGIQKSPARAPVRFHRPYVTVRNVQRGYLDLSHVERFEITPEELSRLRLMPGDILVVEGNGSLAHIGRSAVFLGDGSEWVHQNHVIRVRLDANVARPEFVALYLNSSAGRQQMVERAKTTSGLYTLSTGKVGSLEVPVPSRPEQDGLLAQLAEHDRERKRIGGAAEQQLLAIWSLPKALLRHALADVV
jgi:type I restriction enzyme S subunit